ncbi:MAG: alpha/beta hydrolase [Clostridiales bacterium]|jgi:pimeloyl-ACP methyl ester carboxylesterase|nr:alpha/beta hydrolase [Clostridiales bacterium]
MFIEIENQRINYELAGAGEKTVVFLHGWGGGMAGFRGCFNVLARDFRVVNLELPGFGQSAPPARPFGIMDYARIVRGFIRTVCAGPVHLVGHSFGGRIALILAAEHAEQIEKLVLIDSAGLKPRRGLRRFFRVCRYKFMKRLAERKLIDPKRLEKYGSADYRALSPDMRATFVKVVNRRLDKYAARVRAPTLILWGKRDKDTPVYMAKRLAKLIKNSELRIFPDAGHYSYIDCFWECNELMRAFFLN